MLTLALRLSAVIVIEYSGLGCLLYVRRFIYAVLSSGTLTDHVSKKDELFNLLAIPITNLCVSFKF